MGQQLTGGRERGRMARAAQPVVGCVEHSRQPWCVQIPRHCLGLAVDAGHETRSASRVRTDASHRRRQRLNSPRRPASCRPWGPFRRRRPSRPRRWSSRRPTAGDRPSPLPPLLPRRPMSRRSPAAGWRPPCPRTQPAGCRASARRAGDADRTGTPRGRSLPGRAACRSIAVRICAASKSSGRNGSGRRPRNRSSVKACFLVAVRPAWKISGRSTRQRHLVGLEDVDHLFAEALP